jgi:hypothetical protein
MTAKQAGAKVMERIARRKPQKKLRRTKGARRGFFCARSGSPTAYFPFKTAATDFYFLAKKISKPIPTF